MPTIRILALSAILASGIAANSANTAKADAATRCDWRGCSHIVCNYTGDRCHRFYGGDYYRESYYRDGYYGGGYYGDRYRHYDDAGYRYSDRYRGWHYDCDHDADDCYVHRSGYGD